MQKWEYKLLDGVDINIMAIVNALGAEGWELIASAPEWTFIFKRPLPPPQP